MKFALTAALLVCAPIIHAAQFVSGQAARAEIGQRMFTSESSAANQQTTGAMSGLAFDPIHRLLYIADDNRIGANPENNRVLVFDANTLPAPNADLATGGNGNTMCGVCGYSFQNVLGQVDFGSITPGLAQSAATSASGSLYHPTAVATDGNILAVADTDNNRVLIWKTVPTSTNAPADLVLGQADFTSRQPATTTSAALRGPQGVWIQGTRLFVADTTNNRVLIWNSIPTANNQPADVVLGAPDFSTPPVNGVNATSTAANRLDTPTSVSSDGVHLFVADLANSRVLIWNSIPTQNGQPADVVVGQGNLQDKIVNNSPGLCGTTAKDANGNLLFSPCQKDLNFPRFVLSDGTRLFIADSGNDRVLVYNTIPTTFGAPADAVLGQPDFTSDLITSQVQTISTTVDNTGSVDTMPTPTSLASDGTNLYVADAFNRRVMVFTPGDISLGQRATLNAASKLTRQQGYVTLGLAANGSIAAGDTVTVTIAGTAYAYTVVADDTLATITTKLLNQINSSNNNAGDPNVYAVLSGAIANTLFFNSKGTNLGFDALSLAATTSNTANLVATASGTYLTGGNAGTASVGTIVEIDNPAGLDASGAITSQAFTANSGATADGTTTLPRSLNGVQVFMDGIAVPVLTANPTQVTAQVPFEFSDRGSATVSVRARSGALVSSASPIILAPAAPGLFGTGNVEPRAAFNATHQAGNPSSTVSVDGSVQAGDTGTITVRTRAYTYTVQASDTLLSVATAFAAKINSSTDPEVTASVGGAFNRVIITARQPGSGGSGIPVTAAVTAASGQATADLSLTAYTTATCCASSGTGAVTAANPAVPNETITFLGTGLGAIQDPSGNLLNPLTGVPFNGTQPNSAVQSVNATVNSTTGQITRAGIAQGGNGVYSIDVIMPASLPSSGLASVYIAQNAFISNSVTIPVGSTTSTTVLASFDTPNISTAAQTGSFPVAGWALDTAGTITNVALSIDGVFRQNAQYGISRNDVCAVYGSVAQCKNSGFTATLDASTLSPGTHTIQARAVSATGSSTSAITTVKVSNPLQVHLDSPGAGANAAGAMPVIGWALSGRAPVTQVQIAIDGTVIQTARYGVPRADVCTTFAGSPGCNNVGFTGNVDTTQLSNGVHTLVVTATSSDGRHGSASEQVNVSNSVGGFALGFDLPGTNFKSVLGQVNFRGWVISTNGPVSAVRVAIDGVAYGNATYGSARPDVCAVYKNGNGCPNVGWTFPIDTTRLGSGGHTLAVTAVAAAAQTTSSTLFTVGNGTTADPILINSDLPSLGQTVNGSVNLNGWALSSDATIASVALAVDGAPIGNATYGSVRADVCASFPNRPGCDNVGWTGTFDSTRIADGAHTLAVTATTSAGQSSTFSQPFSVANGVGSVHVGVDAPKAATGALSGTFAANGWAVSDDSTISTVTIKVDGTVIGNATYGGSRGDVCSVFPGRANCPNVGWNYSLDLTQFAPGSHTFEATATSADKKNASVATTFTVATVASPIVVDIDRPGSTGSYFLGSATFSGWAGSSAGTIQSLAVSIDGVAAGAARYGTARPDVCAANAYLNCPNAGWTFDIDTTKLTDGPHTLSVLATSGGQRKATATSFYVQNWTTPNAVLVDIDSPAPNSGGVGGTATFNGWIISDDGGVASVSVAVDGVPYGNATYGLPRADVCSVYPGHAGCPNVGWSFSLDTTMLNDGPHTLSVTSTNAGGQSTTATRTFTVQNYLQ